MHTTKNYIYHLIAILTVGIWGLTFISTKVLIEHGLSPQEIFLLRFLMAYLGIWFISPRKLFADNWKDELWLLWGGVTGGSFYFFTENTALEITLATNVAFIVCTAPLLTTILSLLIYKKEKATAGLVGGSLLALVGVALVVYNGHFILKISPLGDFLTLLAAFSWAFYSLIMKKMSGRYRTTFITRKIFFYGILTILPAFILHPWQFSLSGLWQPAVWMNLLFLGVLASTSSGFPIKIGAKKLDARSLEDASRIRGSVPSVKTIFFGFSFKMSINCPNPNITVSFHTNLFLIFHPSF